MIRLTLRFALDVVCTAVWRLWMLPQPMRRAARRRVGL